MCASRLVVLAVLLDFSQAALANFRFGAEADETACSAADRVPAFLPGVTAEDWATSDEVLTTFWADGCGYGGKDKGREFTYGEVTATGVRQLSEALFGGCSNHNEVVFYDLGYVLHATLPS